MAGESKGARRGVYLDVCCLSRPFDDRSQPRIRLEAEAVLLILSMLSEAPWQWLGSEVVDFEIEQTPDPERRHLTESLAAGAVHKVEVAEAVIERGVVLKTLGFKRLDALHLACAEAAGAEVFLTTDDRLVKCARRVSAELLVAVENPLVWLRKVEKQ